MPAVIRSGIKDRLRSGIKSGINNFGDGWTIDAASGLSLPANGPEWTLFRDTLAPTATQPSHLWNYQEGLGDTTYEDSIGGVTATGVNGVVNQTAIVGMSRFGVAFNQTTNQRIEVVSFENSALVSIVDLIIYIPTAIPAGTVGISTYGTSNIQMGMSQLATDRVRYRNSGSIVDFTAAMATNAIDYICTKQNISGSESKAYNRAQKLSPVFAAIAGSRLDLGATTGASAPMVVPYRVVWKGAAAEAMTDAILKSTLISMGLTAAWT
jgi:hypothetical protein